MYILIGLLVIGVLLFVLIPVLMKKKDTVEIPVYVEVPVNATWTEAPMNSTTTDPTQTTP